MFSADELGLAGADPATPVGDVLPHDALVQGCRDACAGAAELLDVLEMESYERFIPAAEIGFLNLPRNSEAENVAARYLEILCGLISTRTSISGSAPRRSWNREDFRLDTRSVKEVSKFLKTPLFKYDDLTLRDNWNLNLIRQEYGIWCCRAERKPR